MVKAGRVVVLLFIKVSLFPLIRFIVEEVSITKENLLDEEKLRNLQ